MDKLNLLHKFLLITLAALFVVNQSVLSRIQQDLHDALPELRIKNEVLKQGTGEPARVTVTMRDGRVINGHIDRITEYGFVLVERTTEKEIDLTYRIVKEVEEVDSGDGLIASGLTVAARVAEGFARGVR
ncbi:MAG: hypothetical protein IPL32_00190 [Chloracidobacterium sp.]|nr:hypothetical protein [Chloracidobacterium sp.]